MRRIVWSAQPPRTEPDKVRRRRVGTGATVPHEDHRARCLSGLPVQRIRHETKVAVHVARFVGANRDQADARRVAQNRSVDADLVTGGRKLRLLKRRVLLSVRNRDKEDCNRKRAPGRAVLHLRSPAWMKLTTSARNWRRAPSSV